MLPVEAQRGASGCRPRRLWEGCGSGARGRVSLQPARIRLNSAHPARPYPGGVTADAADADGPQSHADGPQPPGEPSLVALTRDLLDRGRIKAALPDATVVRSAAAPELATADVILLDLTAGAAPEEVTAVGAPVVAYGPHGEVDALQAARQAGCVQALPRSKVFRRPEQLRALLRSLAG